MYNCLMMIEKIINQNQIMVKQKVIKWLMQFLTIKLYLLQLVVYDGFLIGEKMFEKVYIIT